jgi:hypothetical protein
MQNTSPAIIDYFKADEWCRNIVSRGHEMLFNLETFDSELNRAAKILNFPVQVRTKGLIDSNVF